MVKENAASGKAATATASERSRARVAENELFTCTNNERHSAATKAAGATAAAKATVTIAAVYR